MATLAAGGGEPIVIAPTEDHVATVVFAHGLGQTNSSWLPVLRPVANRLPGVKWILPQAPNAPVTYSQGRIRPSWFNIDSLPPCNCHDEAGVAASVARLENIVISEVRNGTPSTKIVLVGFSQGAALSLMTALTTLHELGGVASLSGWIPQQSRQAMHQIEPSLPVFWSHGTADEEVPLSYGEECTAFLRDSLQLPVDKVTFKTYEGLEHAVNEDVLSDLAAWLSHSLT
ncbi:Phospholipase/carboxylesterase [Polyporus arcularius HHB13444]|uniref:Acyl-protein thioesterase 1 n=1 Tax=Polyporus arcularius HHB13444 TaxID=1314778 RepID=A0A5C3NYX6_9APHY|nr:Phospholipase/carboxylesterase [Polyporus arcularius HHB13444]